MPATSAAEGCRLLVVVMICGAPFVQFTYAMVPPIPKALSSISAEASELIWRNLPPARVWVYRGR